MRKWLNTCLRRLLCCGLLGFALPLSAQELNTDTLVHDSTEIATADETTPINGEYAGPEIPVIYNSAIPSDDQWNQTVSDKAYDYKDKREYIPKETPPEKEPGWVKFLLKVLNFFNSPQGKFTLWAALILIVGYIVYRLVKGQGSGLFAPRDRKALSGEGGLSEQNLLDADWELKMQEALQSGDTRTAVRYGYLHLLQLLQERDFIAYSPDKTNTDYYRELADKPQRQSFRTATRQYEWAWYGNFQPNREAMDTYLQTFRQLKQSLAVS